MAADAGNFSFGLRIRHVKLALRPEEPPPTNSEGYFRPPYRREQFAVEDQLRYHVPHQNNHGVRQDTLFLWTPHSLAPIDAHEQQRYRPYSVTTIFWGQDRSCFLHVEQDCTKNNITEPKLPGDDNDEATPEGTPNEQLEPYAETWKRLYFRHEQEANGRWLSKVGYHLETPDLTVPMPLAWENTLLPSSFQVDPNPEYRDQTTALAGRLSTLVGIVGFCAPSPEHTMSGISQWFPWRRVGQAAWIWDEHMLMARNCVSHTLTALITQVSSLTLDSSDTQKRHGGGSTVRRPRSSFQRSHTEFRRWQIRTHHNLRLDPSASGILQQA